MLILDIVSGFLILSGSFLILTGCLGMLRFPSFMTRLHPAGIAESLGVPLVILGIILQIGFTLVAAKLFLLLLFLLMTSPTACHALAKAAFGDRSPESELETHDG